MSYNHLVVKKDEDKEGKTDGDFTISERVRLHEVCSMIWSDVSKNELTLHLQKMLLWMSVEGVPQDAMVKSPFVEWTGQHPPWTLMRLKKFETSS
ncbi:hypothetical protein Trydic_g10051 [Trypoxylus dichotomus]